MAEESKHRTDFNVLLIESVKETISEVLGRSVVEPFWHHMQTFLGIAQDEIPYELETLFNSLKNSFGIGGDTLGRVIVRKLYAKAGVDLVSRGNGTLVEHVENLKQILASRPYAATDSQTDSSKL